MTGWHWHLLFTAASCSTGLELTSLIGGLVVIWPARPHLSCGCLVGAPVHICYITLRSAASLA
jgi:hypothetical protein